MGATGLAELHLAILEAVDRASDGSAAFRSNKRVLDLLPEHLEHGPLSAYVELCALATPWTAVLPLLEPNGNFGTEDRADPSADAEYTQCRLSPAGAAALSAERGSGPPIPFGLVLGDWFLGGRRPSFDPARVAWALRLATGGDLDGAVELLGPPAFPGGLRVRPAPRGEDPRALEYGWLVRCRVDAVRSAVPPEQMRGRYAQTITALPPGRGQSEVWGEPSELNAAMYRAVGCEVFRDVDDETSARTGTRIVVVAGDSVGPEDLDDFLDSMPCLRAEFDLQLPRPARELLTDWVTAHGVEATLAGAELLTDLSQRN